MNKTKSGPAVDISFRSVILILAWFGMLLSLSLSSCKTSRSVYKEPIKEEGPDYLFEQLSKNELHFDWFMAKFRTDYRHGKKLTEFKGQIRIKKDSAIWVSFSPLLGIEAARLIITNDSVKFIDRINKIYFVGDYQFVNNYLNTNVDFDILQALVTGNDFQFYEKTRFRASIDNREYRLSTAERHKLKKYVKEYDNPPQVYIQTIWLDPETFKITKVSLTEIQKENKKLDAYYGSFQEIEDQLYPFSLLFELSKNVEEKIDVDIKCTRIKLNEPLSFPFNIPEKYERVY
jgi:hypothetical protein